MGKGEKKRALSFDLKKKKIQQHTQEGWGKMAAPNNREAEKEGREVSGGPSWRRQKTRDLQIEEIEGSSHPAQKRRRLSRRGPAGKGLMGKICASRASLGTRARLHAYHKWQRWAPFEEGGGDKPQRLPPRVRADTEPTEYSFWGLERQCLPSYRDNGCGLVWKRKWSWQNLKAV